MTNRTPIPLLVGLISFVFTVALIAVLPAKAACVCRCVNEVMQPLCDNAIEIRPICPPTVCQHCVPQQVFNNHTRMYEWRTVCY